MTDKLEVTWKEAILALLEWDFKYSPGICLERLRGPTRNVR